MNERENITPNLTYCFHVMRSVDFKPCSQKALENNISCFLIGDRITTLTRFAAS